MKFFTKMKDGGPESKVTGWFLIESKRWFSIALLKFEEGSREAFHSHAFNSISWILKGHLTEARLEEYKTLSLVLHTIFRRSLKPVLTTRDNMHMVSSTGTSWALTFRGRWHNTWREFIPETGRFVTLTHGRKIVVE